MNTSIGKLRSIHFRECYEPPHRGDDLPPGVEELYNLDFWFVFEGGCLFFCHNDRRFRRVAAPPADALPVPATPDELETACLPESFLSASLVFLTAEEMPGFILRFDDGGVIELVQEHRYVGEEGAYNPYLCPQFYSSLWLAQAENAATRAYLEEQMEAAQGHNLLNQLPEEALPPEPLSRDGRKEPKELRGAEKPAGAEAGSGRCVADFVNDVSSGEREQLHRVLWSGENVRWATRPLLHLWNNSSLAHFGLGILWTLWCAFVVCKMWEQRCGGVAEEVAEQQGVSFIFSTLPFWCVGIWLMSSPWRQRFRLRRTLYIITNRRALVAERGFFSWTVRSWNLARDMVADRDVLSGDRGRILFSDRQYSQGGGLDGIMPGGFLYLGNMARAERELRRAIEARRRRA